MVMVFLYCLLLLAFMSGNLTAFSWGNGIRISLLDSSVLLLVVYYLFSTNRRRETAREYLESFGPFIAVAVFSLLLQVPQFSLMKIGSSSLYLGRFVIYSLVSVTIAFSKHLKKWAVVGLWGSGVSVGVLGIFQYIIYPNLRNLYYLGWDPHEFRIFSTLLDPNFTGMILVLTLILGEYLFHYQFQHKSVLLHLFVFLASVLCFLALLLTYSRGSYVAFLAVVIMWVFLNHKFKVGAVVILLLGVGLVLLPQPGGEGVKLLRTISVESRIDDSREAIKLFLTSPLIGVGFNTLRFVRNDTENDEGTIEVSHSGAGFHNSWLFLITTTGLVGTIAYLRIWWHLLVKDTSKLKTNPIKELLLLTFAAVAVGSLFDNSLFYPWIMLWLWILVGNYLNTVINRDPSTLLSPRSG